MEKYPVERRMAVYDKARRKYGDKHQITKALEEMGELMTEIARTVNGQSNRVHLAEELADAYICLEQMQIIQNIENLVQMMMDAKMEQLEGRLRG